MGIKKRQFFLKNRIRNRQFRLLFLKNWCLVFLCIVVPLIVSVYFVRFFSEKTLRQEIDIASRRSTSNTAVTINTLLEEICNTLEKEVVDENVISFIQMEYSTPVKYEFINTVRSVLERISDDYRENLYYSMNVYSETGEYILSTPFMGQSYSRFKDKTLVETFERVAEEKTGKNLVAALRIIPIIDKRVITIYRMRTVNGGKRAFVSISLDAEKLAGYITDNFDGIDGAYLIVDENHQVIMDTSNQLNDQYMEMVGENGITAKEATINDESVWISWVPLEYFQWKFVQIIPMDEIQQNNINLNRLVLMVVFVGMIIATMMSYSVTARLYYPVEAILGLLENPSQQVQIGDQKGEVQYLLISILELFQRNMILEKEMVDRVAALRSARAKALQEQMTPHFLNNVLQTINWTAIMETGNENSMTSRSLLLLADIIRTGMEKTTNLTTVAEEIAYTKKFVELERLRYGENIQCFYRITSSVEQLQIPCISLQTLVENSIIHGLQPKNANGNIYISIHAIGEKGLHICVEDDGVGIEEEKISQIFDKLEKEYIYVGEHLGLINLFQRFRLIYGESCSFLIRKSKFGGACIEIEVLEQQEV